MDRHRFRGALPLIGSSLAAGALLSPVLPASAAPVSQALQSFSSPQTFRTAQSFDSAYTPTDLAAAYDFQPLYNQGMTGSGQKVALIELGAVTTSDMQRFDARYNLPTPTIKNFYVGGKKFATKTDPETTLDAEWLHALAPGATIQIYYTPINQVTPAGWKALGNAVNMAVAKGAKTVSFSIGAPCGTTPGYKSLETALANAEAKGVSVFVASGDSGDHPGSIRDCGDTVGVSYPASDPSIVAVGGTSLQLTDSSTIASEVGWDLSGGGMSAKIPRPLWQTAPGMPSGSTRGVPDVSFVADPQTGVDVAYKGRWVQTGGTSLGAPAWSAAWALVRQSAAQHGVSAGAAPVQLYRIANTSAYTTAFHDITEGSNGEYDAGPGWDPVTGLGTPDVAQLAATIDGSPAS